MVGDAMEPLFRAIPVGGKDNYWAIERYGNPHYIPLQKSTFGTIEIEICNDLGKDVKFQHGRTLVELHFRLRKR